MVAGGNRRLHRRCVPGRLRGHRRPREAGPRPHRRGARPERLRGLHGSRVLRGHGPHHPVPDRSRPGPRSSARAWTLCCGCGITASRFMPMYQRQAFKQKRLPVLGRLDRRGERWAPGWSARSSTVEKAAPRSGTTPGPSSSSTSARRASPGWSCAAPTATSPSGRRRSSWRAAASRQRRVAGALPRPGMGPGEGPGTRHNTGDGIRMALEIGAEPYGHWSGSPRSGGT